METLLVSIKINQFVYSKNSPQKSQGVFFDTPICDKEIYPDASARHFFDISSN